MWNNHQVNQHYGQSERNRRLAKELQNKRNFRLGCLMVLTPILIFLTLAFLMPKKAHAQTNVVPSAVDNTIYVSQIGDNNTIRISQTGIGHNVAIDLGRVSNVDNTTIDIEQKDLGRKTAIVEIPTGINNGINILQQGTGNHTANIQNLNGSGNSINLDQNGAGNHTFNVVAGTGTINNGNTVNAVQSGGVGADKWFQVNLSGAYGATVNVQQTNPTQANQGSMNIQCSSSCGTWSYTRN
jgi:hypothetical protein